MYIMSRQEEVDTDALSFNYTISDFSNEKMSVTLAFAKPSTISTTNEKDTLVIELRDFRDENG